MYPTLGRRKNKAMKQSITPKMLLLAAAIFSCSSFLFVNLHAGLTIPATAVSTEINAGLTPASVTEDENENGNMPMPDVTMLGRMIELAHRLAGKGQ